MILSHDTTVFTTDPRFQVSPPSKTSTPVIRLFPGSLSLSRFTSTRSPASGSCASQDWGRRMEVNIAARWVRAVSCEPTILQKLHQRSLCEYGLYCGTADCLQFRIWRKFTSQAIATPRRKAQVVLEVEETQAEVVGPAELFLRPGSKLELHCRVPLGRAGPDDHFRWTGSPLMRATAIFQEDCSVALVPGSATD